MTKKLKHQHTKPKMPASRPIAGSQPKGEGSSAPRLFYRVHEVAECLGMGYTTVWDGVYAGTIPSRKVGFLRLIPATWVHEGASLEAPGTGPRGRR